MLSNKVYGVEMKDHTLIVSTGQSHRMFKAREIQ